MNIKRLLIVVLAVIVLALGIRNLLQASASVRLDTNGMADYQPTVIVFQMRVYLITGRPTITAAFINRVLASSHSPAAGLGGPMYDLGVKYGIDPVYALAFFWHESNFGTTGEARKTRSLGNERCFPDRSCIDRQIGGYAQMQSWVDGFAQWYLLIRTLYINQWHLETVD